MKQNPYTLVFGKEPNQYISRPTQKAEILDSFTAEEPTQQIYMITGVRGSGKTVLMTDVASVLKQNKDWVTVDLNPEDDLLKSLGAKLYSDNVLAQLFKNLKINISIFGINIEFKPDSEIVDVETAIGKMLEVMKKNNKRLLITIDEATNGPAMRKFAGAFQIFVRQNAPIFLLMTGLFENISELQDEKNLTFLYRATKIKLPPLNIGAISNNYQVTLDIDQEKALKMAKYTKGYPFAFQVLGFLTYRLDGDFQKTISEFRHYLEEYVYEKIWSELSNKDRLVAFGIADSKSGKVSEIREKLDMDTNSFTPYRNRLIKKGLIDGSAHGYVTFTLPFFAEFVKENYY